MSAPAARAATLAPCPFCGQMPVTNELTPDWLYIECVTEKCPAPRITASLARAIAAWNRRVAPSAPDDADRLAAAGRIIEGQNTALNFERDRAATAEAEAAALREALKDTLAELLALLRLDPDFDGVAIEATPIVVRARAELARAALAERA